MNSRTSRPRSPISAITMTSACANRASMPSSVDLPPPAAAPAEPFLDDLAASPAASPDQRDYDNIGLREPCEHAEQRRLAAARRREHAEPLPLAEGQKRINRAHSGRQRRIDQRALHRLR